MELPSLESIARAAAVLDCAMPHTLRARQMSAQPFEAHRECQGQELRGRCNSQQETFSLTGPYGAPTDRPTNLHPKGRSWLPKAGSPYDSWQAWPGAPETAPGAHT